MTGSRYVPLTTRRHRPANDEYRDRFRKSFDTIQSIYDLADEQAANLISDSQVNIVVDLKGWTKETAPAC